MTHLKAEHACTWTGRTLDAAKSANLEALVESHAYLKDSSTGVHVGFPVSDGSLGRAVEKPERMEDGLFVPSHRDETEAMGRITSNG